jgi:hypothetical protein
VREIHRLNAELVELRKAIGRFLKQHGFTVSDLPTTAEIDEVSERR